LQRLQPGGAHPIVCEVADDGTKVSVRRLTQASEFALLDRATIMHVVVVSGSPAARAVATELETFLIERAETLNELSDSGRRASDEAAFVFVRRLEQLGCVVCAGVDQPELRFDDEPNKTRAWHIGCIAVSNLADEAPVVTVKNLTD
jgi:hypothetical protein